MLFHSCGGAGGYRQGGAIICTSIALFVLFLAAACVNEDESRSSLNSVDTVASPTSSRAAVPGQLEAVFELAPPLGPGDTQGGVSFGGGASLDELTVFSAYGVERGVPVWSGLSTIMVGDVEVAIQSAEAVVDNRVEAQGLFVAERGVEGTPGATHGNFPGADTVEGSPRPAVGHVLNPAEQLVVYTTGILREGEEVGVIYGARLTVGTPDDAQTFTLLSPTVLCTTASRESGLCDDASDALILEIEHERSRS